MVNVSFRRGKGGVSAAMASAPFRRYKDRTWGREDGRLGEVGGGWERIREVIVSFVLDL